MKSLQIKRKRQKFVSDSSRVITKFYGPGGEARMKRIIQRVLSLSDEECEAAVQNVLEDFSDRHLNLESDLLANYQETEYLVETAEELSRKRKLLLGAYFTQEYSIESAALFNPSIVAHPDQTNLEEGSVRCILSFRAIGEGQISSIIFRSGVLDANCNFIMDCVRPFLKTPIVELNPTYDKKDFLTKLKEARVYEDVCARIFEKLPNRFLFNELQESIREVAMAYPSSIAVRETIELIFWVARSDYEASFHHQTDLSERVIFPVARNESNGIEDARFVRFTDDDGDIRYYATYTAFNGHTILPMLLETRDFLRFRMRALSGKPVRDRGLTLFPRKINGKYMMISRYDGENLYLMSSDDIHFWDSVQKLQTPTETWELIQIGNCGPPIETEAGWLLLTHGVGPLRKYCIGVQLLDLNDPSKIIGRSKTPLIMPNEYEREGYLPNVVYTCGAIVHNDKLVIPYAASDTTSGIAVIGLNPLLERLLQ
ncbi:glycoside hydrolase family 130 protein [Desulfonema magnum]|uniref:Mannoside phosphorylase domain-containing protein n=1 Tax=Desulfonema magnum TaxID=45655 RepID=A0A975BRN3_9BACT|nr:glycoside hydrolase family 130 protein [Desulfonema magnum]QTA90457.1 Mannoside phosphorylase domain-containing protein [Desulfonema magnum]